MRRCRDVTSANGVAVKHKSSNQGLWVYNIKKLYVRLVLKPKVLVVRLCET